MDGIPRDLQSRIQATLDGIDEPAGSELVSLVLVNTALAARNLRLVIGDDVVTVEDIDPKAEEQPAEPLPVSSVEYTTFDDLLAASAEAEAANPRGPYSDFLRDLDAENSPDASVSVG